MGTRPLNFGIIAGLLTGIQVGAAIFASQFVVDDLGIGLLGLLRYGIALLVLLPFLMSGSDTPIAKRDLLFISVLGMGQIGVMIALLNTAVLFTNAARVALVFATLPAVSFVIDKLRGLPSGSRLTSAGVVLTIAGVAVLVGHDAFADTLTTSDIIGITAAFGATLIVAVCSSWYSPYVQRYGTIRVSVTAFIVSLPALALLTLLFPPTVPVSEWSMGVWRVVLLVGLSSGIGYLLWFHAIGSMSATAVTGFLALSPITAAVLSQIFVGTELTTSLIIAILIVSAGISCFVFSKQQESKAISYAAR
ncbi:hypothetical protein TW78_17875 [Vibrio coralliilyticus]|uniref:Uncharacterized protein n=1 Tax=Vibrio coralliilyticus TaxID=190893 RepID=A0A837G789_9VIBR|nr:DMT family transporter [Vibrio coralliilyticus]KJY70114.1 hypothetical protein TW78_17875 [Vibrio coralliilyticus]QOU32526.1 DMT family transporter [Vibrio coralliilyticus]